MEDSICLLGEICIKTWRDIEYKRH